MQNNENEQLDGVLEWTERLTLKEGCYSWDQIHALAPEDEYHDLARWMTGQTMRAFDDGDAGVYPHDFRRWLAQGRRTEQGADWD